MTGERVTPDTPFVWPPRSSGDAPMSRPPEPEQRCKQHGPIARALGAMSHDAERVFLGTPGGTLRERLELALDGQPEACWRCGQEVGPHETDGAGCPACRGKRPHWAAFVRLGLHDGELRELVHELKFTRWRRVGEELGREIGRRVLRLPQVEAALARPDAGRAQVVPVPMSRVRRLVRGIDHTRCIARGIRSVTGWAIHQPLLRGYSPSQLAVPVSARARNVRRTFHAGKAWRDTTPALVVVVDDVLTTGSTLGAACRAVRRAAGRHEDGSRPVLIAACASMASDPARRKGNPAEPSPSPGGGTRPINRASGGGGMKKS